MLTIDECVVLQGEISAHAGLVVASVVAEPAIHLDSPGLPHHHPDTHPDSPIPPGSPSDSPMTTASVVTASPVGEPDEPDHPCAHSRRSR